MLDPDIHDSLQPGLGNVCDAAVLQVFAQQHTEHRRSHRAGLILFRQVDQGQGGVGRQKESALACLRLHRQKQFVVLGLCDLI